MVAIETVLEGIERRLKRWSTGGQDEFRQFAYAQVDDYRDELSQAEIDAVAQKIEAWAAELPVLLSTDEDFAKARLLCHRAAQRLRGLPAYAAVVDTWPAPIAHELKRLVRELEGTYRGGHPSPEAALLQLRDTMDCLIKLPAIGMVIAVIARGGEAANTMRQRLSTVSGGGWVALARDAAASLRSAGPAGPWAALVGLFGDVHAPFLAAIGRWPSLRNHYLGHAALRPNPAETAAIVCWVVAREAGDPPPDGMALVPTLAAALAAAAAADPWHSLSLQVDGPEGPIALIGAAAIEQWHVDARHTAHQGRILPVRLTCADGTDIPLGPLAAARICTECGKRDVFLFDSVYQHRSWQHDFLDYGRGHKARMKGDAAADMTEVLIAPADRIIPPDAPTRGLDSGETIARLDRMRIERRYRSPKHLRRRLDAFLKGQDRGVYWLQAPAHVGKTTFIQGLIDPALPDEPIAADLQQGQGGGVAVFFCKTEYREGQVTFLNGLAESLKAALDLRPDASAHFPDTKAVTTAKPAERRQAFAAWLDAWRQLPGGRDPGRILVVVDGLDEADAPATGNSLLDLLPAAADLPPGVLLLLTSRPVGDANCPPWLERAMVPVMAGQTPSPPVALDDPDYLDLLRDYAASVLPSAPGIDLPALIERLIIQADRRFVYVSFLTEQLRNRRVSAEGVADLGVGPAIYEGFIASLEAVYGSKRADGLLAVLACLAGAELAHAWVFGDGAQPDVATGAVLEPMSRDWPGLPLDLLAGLVGMDTLRDDGRRWFDVAFVEALLLLQGALQVWRGAAAPARYRLGQKEMAAQLHVVRPEAVRLAQARLATLALDAAERLAAALDANDNPDAGDERSLRELAGLLPGLMALASSELLEHRYAELDLVRTCIVLEARKVAETPSVPQVQWYSGAIALAGRQAAPGAAPHDATSLLAIAYINRGNAKHSAPGFGPGAAIQDYDQAIALHEALRDTLGEGWPVPWRNGLANAYMNRGNAKQSAPGFGPGAAIQDYDLAIALQEALRHTLGEGWPVPWRNELAGAYMNRGNAKQDAPGFGPGAAIQDYDQAIALQEALRDTLGEGWPVPWRNDLANAYMNRGVAKQSAPGFGPGAAIQDHDQAIALREALRDTLGEGWPVQWRNELASAYMNRGNAKPDAPGFGPGAAIQDYDQAIALQEALRDTLGEGWPVPWRNDLARAYVNRGNAKHSAPGFGPSAAIQDYDQAIALQEALRDTLGEDWPVPWRNELASAYMNRGTAKQDAPGFGPGAAIQDYDQAIALQEALRHTLGEGWPVPWRNDLANAYMNRGNAKQSAPGFGPGAAIQDYDQAIALQKALRDTLGEGWPVPWRNDLASAYVNRGNAKQSALGFGPGAAIQDYDQAIALQEALRDTLGEGWPVPWRNDLANAYMNRGNAKQSAPGFGPSAAIQDYDQAIALRQALRDTLREGWPVPWRNDLARAYMNRGNAKRQAGDHDSAAALDDYALSNFVLAPLLDRAQPLFPPAVDTKLHLSSSMIATLQNLHQHDEATDAADEGLHTARWAEQNGVRWYRQRRERLFATALDAYARAGMQAVLPDVIFDDLDPAAPGSAVDSASMHAAASSALAAALLPLLRTTTPEAQSLHGHLLSAQTRLAALQVGRFAGSAGFARINAGREFAAGRPDEAWRILDRQVAYRPDDPAGHSLRADFRAAHARPDAADDDRIQAARLTIAAIPAPSETGALMLATLCAAMLHARLAIIAADPIHADPAQGATTRRAFDALQRWLIRELPDTILPDPARAAWKPPLDAALERAWHEAAALRETIVAAQEHRWEGDLRRHIAQEAARHQDQAFTLAATAVPMQWLEFVRGLLLAVNDAEAATADLPRHDREAAVTEALESALRQETERLNPNALPHETAALAAQLGPHWDHVLETERKYLAVTSRCAKEPAMAKFGVLELACAVEWSLGERLLRPLREAIGHGHPIPPRTPGEADRLHAYLTHQSNVLMLGDSVRSFTRATKLLGRPPPATVDGTLAAWLADHPNPAKLANPATPEAKRRRRSLHDLSDARNAVAHPKPKPDGQLPPPPPLAPHWQAMVEDPDHAFFRYFPALFTAPGPSSP